MIAPRRRFLGVRGRVGEAPSRLARALETTESLAVLRLGEVTGEPIALVTPARVRLRGTAYSWPSEPELRALASAPRVAGIRKVRLTDDPRRVVIRAVG